MTQPRLTAEFQPLGAEGRGGMERVFHQGPSTTLDITAYVLGLDVKDLRDLRDEAGRPSGKDLDHVADMVPGFVEANTGTGGFDLLLDDADIDAFFEEHGLETPTVTEEDLARLRGEYGTEPKAPPVLASEVPAPAGPR